MGRADAASIEAVRSKSSIFGISIIDFITLIFTFFVLIFFCNDGTLPDNQTTQLTLFHLVHLAMIVSACILFRVDELYVPLVFGLLAVALFVIDTAILVVRGSILIDNPNLLELCNFILFLSDILFFVYSLWYVVSVARTARYFGVLGSTDESDVDPFLGPSKS